MSLTITKWSVDNDERDMEDFYRHNYLARPREYPKPSIPTGEKVRNGLGYPPTVKLMPHLNRPWVELGK